MSSPPSRRKLDLKVRTIADLRRIAFQIGMLGYDTWREEESQALRDAILRTEEGRRMYMDSGLRNFKIVVPKEHPKIAAVVASSQKRSRDSREDVGREALIGRERAFRDVLTKKAGWADRRMRQEAKLGYLDVVESLLGSNAAVQKRLLKLRALKASKQRAGKKAAKHMGDDPYVEALERKKVKYSKAKTKLYAIMEEAASRKLF